MRKVGVAFILSSFLFSFGQEEGATKKAEYLGAWSGDPAQYLARLNFIVFPLSLRTYYCILGSSKGEDIIKDIDECLKDFTSKNEPLATECSSLGFTHYGFSNFRTSHSNVIAWNGVNRVYGHLIIFQADGFCAKEIGKR